MSDYWYFLALVSWTLGTNGWIGRFQELPSVSCWGSCCWISSYWRLHCWRYSSRVSSVVQNYSSFTCIPLNNIAASSTGVLLIVSYIHFYCYWFRGFDWDWYFKRIFWYCWHSVWIKLCADYFSIIADVCLLTFDNRVAKGRIHISVEPRFIKGRKIKQNLII